MLRTLALKELRETAGIAILALILFANFVVGAMGVRMVPWSSGSMGAIPFVNDPVLPMLSGVAVLLAVALGFRQSSWESAFGTDQFLLHRPASWGQLLGVKLFVGVGLLVVVSIVPILVYAWWAATPGTHASPFAWSMTEPFWRIPVVVPTVYVASFLSGVRPARWVGTRLVPLAAGALMAGGSAALPPLLMVLSWWWIWWVLIVVGLDVLLVVGILFAIRTRDY